VTFLWGRREVRVVERVRGENPDEEFAKVLLDEGREELDRADAKSSMLLSASGVVAGALLAGTIAGDWTPTQIHDHRVRALFWFGLGLAAIGVFLLGSAVLPRTRNPGDKKRLAYFGDVVKFRERGITLRKKAREAKVARGKDEFRAAVSAASGSRLERTLDQVWAISGIVLKKYRRIRGALFSLATAMFFCGAALFLSARW
jgi:hypothetical protein